MNELLTNTQVVKDIKTIIEEGRKSAFVSASQIAINTYWNIGKRIVEEEQHGKERAEYGTYLLRSLADILTKEYGAGFKRRNLEQYRQFYLCFKDIEIANARVRNLTWTHIRRIMTVADPDARLWYLNEAANQNWSTRTLDRNIETQYYGRMLSNQRKGLSLPIPENEKANPLEYIKNPFVAEFLGFQKDSKYEESELEQALIDNLEKFILELGKGFAFVDRQKHITTDTGDFYIDLVFYNFKLKSFVLFELKTHKLTHQDIGQIDMYVRMYDDMEKSEDDNPTIGVLLCTDTDNTIAKYSVLNGNDQVFAAKYMSYMPTEDELKLEIEQQKKFFLASHEKENKD